MIWTLIIEMALRYMLSKLLILCVVELKASFFRALRSARESELRATRVNTVNASIWALTSSEHCPQIKAYSFLRLLSRISSRLAIPSIFFYHLCCSAADDPAGRSAGNAKSC